MRSPDEMDVDTIGSGQYHTEWESLDAVGKGGIYCYRCGGQGHIAAKCGTPDPGKSKGKGGLGPQANPSKGKGKGKGGLVSQANPLKGKGKGDWKGFCSYCGKRGHTPRDCWTKQRDEESGKETLGAVDDFEHEVHNEEDITVGGFDIGVVDTCWPKSIWEKWEEEGIDVSVPYLNGVPQPVDTATSLAGEWVTVGKKGRKISLSKKSCHHEKDIMAVNPSCYSLGKGRITVDSGAAESVMPKDILKEVQLRESEGSKNGIHYKAADRGRMPNYGEKKVEFQMVGDGQPKGIHSITFQVTDATKPLAAVSKMVKKGNRVVFDPQRSYIENIQTGKQINLIEVGGTYQMEVEYMYSDLVFPRRE